MYKKQANKYLPSFVYFNSFVFFSYGNEKDKTDQINSCAAFFIFEPQSSFSFSSFFLSDDAFCCFTKVEFFLYILYTHNRKNQTNKKKQFKIKSACVCVSLFLFLFFSLSLLFSFHFLFFLVLFHLDYKILFDKTLENY